MSEQSTIDDLIAVASAVLVPVDAIVPGDNDRTSFDLVDLQALASSIKEHGLIQPITLRPGTNGRYIIVAGERRWRASRLAGIASIPAVIRRDLTDETAALLMLEENLKRSDLDAVDEAHGYRKRIEQFGYTIDQLAFKANVTQARIRERLALLTLHPDVQKLVRVKDKSKSLPLSHAAVMAGLNEGNQIRALRLFLSGGRPRIERFREECGRLEALQNQDTMDGFMTGVADEHVDAAISNIHDDRVETRCQYDEALLKLFAAIPRQRGIGVTIRSRASALRDAGLDREATVVETLLHQLLSERSVYDPV